MNKSLFNLNISKKLTWDKIFSHELITETTMLETVKQLTDIEEAVDKDSVELWRKAVALSILYHKMCKRSVSVKIVEYFNMVMPFKGDRTTFGELIQKQNSAMVHFPLATKDVPKVVQLWVIEDIVYYFSEEEWSGNSYKLARTLARRAATEENWKIKESLATTWIVTGDVDGNSVKKVELGNKLELKTKRKWLIPLDSMKKVTMEQRASLILRTTDTTTTAWNHISSQGSKELGTKQWPTNIDELHMLVGKNIKAQVASILLTKCPKVVLWHSENEDYSKKQADDIIVVIEKIGSDYTFQKKELHSANIIDSEKVLRNYFDKKSNNKILFNVTSGNRLMSFAVQSLAMLYPNIDLIYRDATNKKENEFTKLNYREFPPYLGTMTGNIPQSIHIKFLYDNQKYNSVDEFYGKLNNEIPYS